MNYQYLTNDDIAKLRFIGLSDEIMQEIGKARNIRRQMSKDDLINFDKSHKADRINALESIGFSKEYIKTI